MIFDGHGDIWTDITVRTLDHNERNVFEKRHLEKFRKGGISGGIFVIWIDPPHDQNPEKRMQQILEGIRIEKACAGNVLNFVEKYEDLEKGTKEGKINAVTGIEGLSGIGEDIDMIDVLYHEAGARHAMLTWNEANALATGWPQDVNRGMTDLGKKAVLRMQDLGMVMDVSHLNDKCFWDMISLSNGRPVIASHSNCRALCSAMRNLTDDMIKAIAETGGLLGMNSMREFISDEEENQNVEHLVNHIDHVVELVGIDHVGLGFDFDDYLEGDTLSSFSGHIDSPSGVGITNAAEAGNVIRILKERGYSKEEIEKIAYGNYYRVFRESWK